MIPFYYRTVFFMARTNNVTSRVIDLNGFRSLANYVASTQDWINSVREREDIFEEMRDDARVESLVIDRKNKVLQMYGSFTESRNKRVNEACENILTFNTFYKLNNILLNAVPYGLAACEVLWKFADGWYVPYDFVPIPRTALSFPQHTDLDWDIPVLTSQNIALSDRLKFIIHRNDDGELNAWGRPALRSAYIFWKFKQLGVKFWAMAAELCGVPSILAIFETKSEEEAKKRAAGLTEALRNWESGSSGAFGNVKDIKVVSSQINDFNKVVELCDTEIAYALTAQSLTTNTAQYGTNAQGLTHVQTYDNLIKGDAYKLQQTDQQLVDAFVELNFPGELAPQYDIDSTDFAPWEVIRDAIDRGVPVSLKALYNKVHLPKPMDEKDSFVKAQPSFGFSDNGKDDFFQNRQ
jgi:phage gp29-like protein